jgi:hypothetical protein
MKDYGSLSQQISFLDKHRTKIGSALSTTITLIVLSIAVMVFMLRLPAAIDQLEGHSSEVVAISKGISE